MVATSRKSFKIKPDVTSGDFTTKKRILQHFGSKIATIASCYYRDLGQYERNIFDFSLCALLKVISYISPVVNYRESPDSTVLCSCFLCVFSN